MVHSDNIVAHELEDTTNAISLNGRAQVADMHVLGNVWWWEIDQNALLLLWIHDRFLWLFLYVVWCLSGSCWYLNVWCRCGPRSTDLLAESTDKRVPGKGSWVSIGVRWVATKSHVIIDVFPRRRGPAQPLSLQQSGFDRVCHTWSLRLLNWRSFLLLLALTTLSLVEIKSLLQADWLLHVDVLDLAFDELGLKENVDEKARLCAIALSSLS